MPLSQSEPGSGDRDRTAEVEAEVEVPLILDEVDEGVWLTSSQVAQLLGVAASTVAGWVDAGRLQAIRTAGGDRRRGSVRVQVSEVRRLARALGQPVGAAELATLQTRAVAPGVHGTRTSYNRGCRCQACTEANRACMRAWQARHGHGGSRGKGKGNGKAQARDGLRQARVRYATATTLDELLKEW